MSLLRRAVSRTAGVLTLAPFTRLVVLPSPQALAVQLFSDNFETGVLVPPWTATANFTNQTAIVFAGARAGRATTSGPGAYAYKDLSPAQANVYLKTRIRVASTGARRRYCASGGRCRNEHHLAQPKQQRRAGEEEPRHRAGRDERDHPRVEHGYDLQIHALINGTSSVFEVWLNGTLVSDISGTVSLGTGLIGRPQLGSNSTSNGYDIVYDDVIVDTAFIGGGGGTPPPPRPVSLRRACSRIGSTLSWVASPGATSYTVLRTRARNPGGTTGTTFSDTTVSPSTQYSYTVTATNGSGTSAPSSPPVVVTTPSGWWRRRHPGGSRGRHRVRPHRQQLQRRQRYVEAMPHEGHGATADQRGPHPRARRSAVRVRRALRVQPELRSVLGRALAQEQDPSDPRRPGVCDDRDRLRCGGCRRLLLLLRQVLAAQPGNTAEDPTKGYYSFEIGRGTSSP